MGGKCGVHLILGVFVLSSFNWEDGIASDCLPLQKFALPAPPHGLGITVGQQHVLAWAECALSTPHPLPLLYTAYFFFFQSKSHFLQVQKGAFHFPYLKKKVRKNTLSLLKGNILLLALLYVQRFLAPLILNSVHEWMDNFLPVSFFMLLNYLLLPQLVAVSPLISGWAVVMPEAPLRPPSWGAAFLLLGQPGILGGTLASCRTTSLSNTAWIHLICLHHSHPPNPESFWLPSAAPFQSPQCPACNIVTRIARYISNILPLMSYIK